jgi:hypothetical protein
VAWRPSSGTRKSFGIVPSQPSQLSLSVRWPQVSIKMRPAQSLIIFFVLSAVRAAAAQERGIPIRVTISSAVLGATGVDTAAARRAFLKPFATDSLFRILPPVRLPPRRSAPVDPHEAIRVDRMPGARFVVEVAVIGSASRLMVRVRAIDIETSTMAPPDSAIVNATEKSDSAFAVLGSRMKTRLLELASPRRPPNGR